MDSKVQYWSELCRYDIDTARVMLEGKRYLYVGFMCHQSIEKILKAYYAKIKSDVPPYTHNLLRLSEITGLWDEFDDEQTQLILALNPLNIEARYPIQKQKLEAILTNDYCSRLIVDTEVLSQWIENKLLS